MKSPFLYLAIIEWIEPNDYDFATYSIPSAKLPPSFSTSTPSLQQLLSIQHTQWLNQKRNVST